MAITSVPASAPLPTGLVSRGRPSATPLRRAARSILRDPPSIVGVLLFVLIVVVALFAPTIAPYDPSAVHVRDRLQLPSSGYLLGTDELGRDLLSRIIFGTRISLMVGVIAVGIAATAGILLGLASAFYGGLVDSLVMRALDGVLAFPAIILALAIITALGPSASNAMIAIGIVSIPTFARITRGNVLSLKEKEFVEASRASGATSPYLMLRVLLPNCVSPLLVQASVAFANAILTEAALRSLDLVSSRRPRPGAPCSTPGAST